MQHTLAAPVKTQDAPKQSDNPLDPNAVPAPAPSQTATGADVDLKLVEPGEGLYKAYCMKCHGLQMVTPGGGFFDLRTFPLNDKPRFISAVVNGKRAMPAWGTVIKGSDLEAIWAYVANYQLARDAKGKAGDGK
ncbi:MAG: cytochrome c [Burkholderiaceae bacterium]|nr:cytochrome c [Burkholderiaceae bacterium]